MSVTRAKYFERAKRLVVFGPTWTLTVRVSSKGSLPSVLNQHRLRHRQGRRWQRVGNIYYSELMRRR